MSRVFSPATNAKKRRRALSADEDCLTLAEIEALERLGALRANGALTHGEFEEQKMAFFEFEDIDGSQTAPEELE
jgi:hypothetical protein